MKRDSERPANQTSGEFRGWPPFLRRSREYNSGGVSALCTAGNPPVLTTLVGRLPGAVIERARPPFPVQ